MKEIGIAVLIIGGLIGIIVLYFILKPYVIKHDTTILFTGGLGSGKTCESVKCTIVCIRLLRLLKYYCYNFKTKIINKCRKTANKRRNKKYESLVIIKGEKVAENWRNKHPNKEEKPLRKKPLVYSNVPMQFKSHLFGWKKEWATQLTVEHLLLIKEINEYSVVFIDEFPQFISQFDWDIDLVQKNCNEFITFFRHYIGGNLIINAQSEDEIECHFRRKLNQGIWCFDFHVWPCKFIPLFYTNRMCDFMLSDNIQTVSTTYIEENTKIHFGLFPRKCYDTRCYSPRYEKIHIKVKKTKKWKQLKTKEVLRLREYISPLDTSTTPRQIEAMENQIRKLERNNDNENK